MLLYVDIYLISSARNKIIILSHINCFPRLHWHIDTHPNKEGGGLYSSREHQYSCISILMPKGSFQHQHEHETCIRLDLNILEERKYFWSQTLCQCLVRSVTKGCSVLIGPWVECWSVIGCFWQVFADLILSPHRIAGWDQNAVDMFCAQCTVNHGTRRNNNWI